MGAVRVGVCRRSMAQCVCECAGGRLAQCVCEVAGERLVQCVWVGAGEPWAQFAC